MKKITFRWINNNGNHEENQEAIEEKIKDTLEHEDCQACTGNGLIVEIGLDAMSHNKVNGSILCSCDQLLYIINGINDRTVFDRQNLEDKNHGHD